VELDCSFLSWRPHSLINELGNGDEVFSKRNFGGERFRKVFQWNGTIVIADSAEMIQVSTCQPILGKIVISVLL
jgi:hypothetical protein